MKSYTSFFYKQHFYNSKNFAKYANKVLTDTRANREITIFGKKNNGKKVTYSPGKVGNVRKNRNHASKLPLVSTLFVVKTMFYIFLSADSCSMLNSKWLLGMLVVVHS